MYISNNLIKDWSEFNRLQEIPTLEDLLFVGNPLAESYTDESAYRAECVKRVPTLKKLDGETIISDVDSSAQAAQAQNTAPAETQDN